MGKRIGNYILGETLGQGSFGKVKLATNVKTGEKVTISVRANEGSTGGSAFFVTLVRAQDLSWLL